MNKLTIQEIDFINYMGSYGLVGFLHGLNKDDITALGVPSTELNRAIAATYNCGNTTIAKTAKRFGISEGHLNKILGRIEHDLPPSIYMLRRYLDAAKNRESWDGINGELVIAYAERLYNKLVSGEKTTTGRIRWRR